MFGENIAESNLYGGLGANRIRNVWRGPQKSWISRRGRHKSSAIEQAPEYGATRARVVMLGTGSSA